MLNFTYILYFTFPVPVYARLQVKVNFCVLYVTLFSYWTPFIFDKVINLYLSNNLKHYSVAAR